jgi:uncharacterized repeat protein (TIGR01451 family)
LGSLIKGFPTLVVICFISGLAFSQNQGNIELKMIAEKEMVFTDAQGKKQIKRVEPAKVIPGEEIIYTITYTNSGDQNADNVYITNPVPEHMLYKEGSAEGIGTVITFSVDGGVTYDIPSKLKVKNIDGTLRPAVAEDYTHIRWTLKKPLSPKGNGNVVYRAILK